MKRSGGIRDQGSGVRGSALRTRLRPASAALVLAWLFLVTSGLASSPIPASDALLPDPRSLIPNPPVAFADGHLDREAQEIAKQLKCPVCQNLSVADSPSPLAEQMRESIRERLAAGQSREEILAYFTERYGEEVRLDPPKTGFSQVIWWGPAVILIGGAGAVAYVFQRRLRRRNDGADGLPRPALSESELRQYEAFLEAELDHGDRPESPVASRESGRPSPHPSPLPQGEGISTPPAAGSAVRASAPDSVGPRDSRPATGDSRLS